MTALRDDRLPDGTLLLRSPLLESEGIPHAFSTALGPEGRCFDLSRPGHSPLETPSNRLESDIGRFAAAVVPDGILSSPRQVHGIDIVDACVADDSSADATCTSDPGRIAAIRTADCVPILLACPRRNEVIAIHAGWRGLVADAPGSAVRALVSRGSDPGDLVAAIGPAIGVSAFEIGEEVAAEFETAGLKDTLRPGTPRPHGDLHQAATLRLLGSGIPPTRIDGEPTCTASSPRFFSHRRDQGRTGRHLSAIAPRSDAGSNPSDLRTCHE